MSRKASTAQENAKRISNLEQRLSRIEGNAGLSTDDDGVSRSESRKGTRKNSRGEDSKPGSSRAGSVGNASGVSKADAGKGRASKGDDGKNQGKSSKGDKGSPKSSKAQAEDAEDNKNLSRPSRAEGKKTSFAVSKLEELEGGRGSLKGDKNKASERRASKQEEGKKGGPSKEGESKTTPRTSKADGSKKGSRASKGEDKSARSSKGEDIEKKDGSKADDDKKSISLSKEGGNKTSPGASPRTSTKTSPKASPKTSTVDGLANKGSVVKPDEDPFACRCPVLNRNSYYSKAQENAAKCPAVELMEREVRPTITERYSTMSRTGEYRNLDTVKAGGSYGCTCGNQNVLAYKKAPAYSCRGTSVNLDRSAQMDLEYKARCSKAGANENNPRQSEAEKIIEAIAEFTKAEESKNPETPVSIEIQFECRCAGRSKDAQRDSRMHKSIDVMKLEDD